MSSNVATSAPRVEFRLSFQATLLMLVFLLVYLEGFITERLLGVTFADTRQGPNFLLRATIEALLIFALIWSLLRSRTRRLPPGSIFFLAYAAWAMLASVENGVSAFHGFLYARYTLYSLAIYFIAWNNSLRPQEIKRIIRLLIKLFLLQIISTLIMLPLFGVHEFRVGTLTLGGGELATVFPLLALGFAMGWYFFVCPRLWVLLLGISFGVIGYSSGKRAIYFLVPVFFIINAALYLIIRRRMAVRPPRSRIVLHGFVTGMIGIVPLVLGMMTTHEISDVFQETSGAWNTVSAVIQFVEDYNNNVRPNGQIGGRNTASAAIFVGVIVGGPRRFLYGWGPDAIKLDNEDESISATGAAGFSDLAVYYGIVGWSRDAISIGLIGSLLYFLAYASVFRTAFIALKGPDFDHYAEMLGFGACAGVLALMVCYLIYASTFASIGAITFPLTFAVGIVSSPTQVLNRPARSAQLLGSAPA